MPEPQPTPKSAVPEGLQALKELEQNRMAATPTPPAANQATSTPKTGNKIQDKLKEWWELLKKQHIAVKVLFGVVAMVGLLFLCMAILTLTAIDAQIFKLTLVGTVVDQNQQPIPNVLVVLDENQVTGTDENGVFTFSSLEVKKYNITFTADAYEELEIDIAMSRSFLNYTNNRTFELKSAGKATVLGKLNPPDATYLFLDDSVLIGEEEYPVKSDGTFELSNVKTGPQTITFRSVNFKDVSWDLGIIGGRNELEAVDLVPAGDIVGSVKSWIREDLVTDLKITAEGVPSDQIEIDDEGNFSIRDLEVAKSYKIRTEKDGYQTRDYEIGIKQGENELFGFKVVESGRIPFLRQSGSSKYLLFATDYDGSNETGITTDAAFDPRAEYLEGDNVYFLSPRDAVSSTVGGDGLIAYVASINGGNPQKLTTNTDRWGKVRPAFAAKKLAMVTRGATTNERILLVMGLDGNNRVEIRKIPEGNINDPIISGNGEAIYFQMQNKAGDINGLYRASATSGNAERIADKEGVLIYSVSDDGNKVIYSAENDATKLQDLYLYTHSTKQDTLLRAAFSGSQYQFIKGSSDVAIFHDLRGGGNNLYKLILSSNSETKITNFSGTEGIDAIYQQGDLVVYQTNRGLYLLDIDTPKLGKQVTTSFARYTGYDF